MSVLLDTDAYSALMRGHPVVAARVRETDRVLLSTIVVGELLFGFRCGTRHERNRRNLEVFLRSAYVGLVPVTWATAERFGRIAAALRAKGKPIPTNDIWIAAHAMETGADLLSFDQHYSDVDGLAWVDPSQE
jgi:tRNA(fMet)-specific endonuclease VapC